MRLEGFSVDEQRGAIRFVAQLQEQLVHMKKQIEKQAKLPPIHIWQQQDKREAWIKASTQYHLLCDLADTMHTFLGQYGGSSTRQQHNE